MDPSKFVKEVSVGINLSSLEGWKIVDTPGVCALGGIEELTRNYVFGTDEYGYNNVDAVLLVYNKPFGMLVFVGYVTIGNEDVRGTPLCHFLPPNPKVGLLD